MPELRARWGCSALLFKVCPQQWHTVGAPAEPSTRPPHFWRCKRAWELSSRVVQLWGAGLQPPLFGLPAGRKWDNIQHTAWQGISKQHKKLQSTNLTYFLGGERKILSRAKATVTPLCTLGAEILCALCLFTYLYQQRLTRENWEKVFTIVYEVSDLYE